VAVQKSQSKEDKKGKAHFKVRWMNNQQHASGTHHPSQPLSIIEMQNVKHKKEK